MDRRRDPVPRARSAGHWLGGILLLGLLGGGVVAAAVLLWENLDVRRLAPTLVAAPGPIPDPVPPAPPAFEKTRFPAVLFRSARNASYFPDSSFYPRVLARWRQLVEEVGGEVREAGSAAELRGLEPEELLVLPEAPCLSRAEIAAIRAHLQRGGSMVSNWAVGARDDRCEWRGWQFVAEVTEAGDVRELQTRPALYLTVPAGLPLSPGLDPGTRIELRPEPTLAVLRPGPRVYWSDWALNPAPDESGGGADVAAVAIRMEEGGRSSWFGFRLSQAATARDSLRMDRLVSNGILWAAGRPMIDPSPWPGGRRAALVFLEDVEAEYGNASAAAQLFRELEVPGSFYVVSQLVLEDPELAAQLTSAGEVGSQTSDHQPVAGLPYSEQLVRLRRSWNEIRRWAGAPPAGLRPPEETFDINTLRAWQELGGRYLMAVNQARSAAPEIHRVGGNAGTGASVVLLPRLLKDDYNVFVQEGAVRAERLSSAFLEGIEKLRAVGGLAVVAVHTQIVGTGRRLNALRAVADSARSQGDWWVASAGEVAEWWRSRASVRFALVNGAAADSASSGSLEIRIESDGVQPLDDLWLDLVLPDGGEDLLPFLDGRGVPSRTTEWGLKVPVGRIAPGERHTLLLRPAESLEEGGGG